MNLHFISNRNAASVSELNFLKIAPEAIQAEPLDRASSPCKLDELARAAHLIVSYFNLYCSLCVLLMHRGGAGAGVGRCGGG